MIQTDRNMSTQTVSKNIILTLVQLLVLMCEMFINAQIRIKLELVESRHRNVSASRNICCYTFINKM